MNSDQAAWLMGLAAVMLLTGYRLFRKRRVKKERKMLVEEFQTGEEHTDE